MPASAFLQAPLTIDYDAAVDSINELDTKTFPEGGTNISEAIALATRTFGKSATGNRALIIFTDGEDLSGDAVRAAKAPQTRVRIFTVGVGTPGLAHSDPGEGGGTAFVKDAQGQVVKSKLDETRLREVAQAAGGTYVHLENGPRTMQQLFSDGWPRCRSPTSTRGCPAGRSSVTNGRFRPRFCCFAFALLINDERDTDDRESSQQKLLDYALSLLILVGSTLGAGRLPGIQP